MPDPRSPEPGHPEPGQSEPGRSEPGSPKSGSPEPGAADPRVPPSGRPPVPRTAREMLALARAFLERKGLGAPDGEARREAEILVSHALGLDRLGLYMQIDRPLDGAEVDRARDLLVRRGRREPTAYIVGQREFFGRDFGVGPGVLVPRPETEGIVDRAREIAKATALEAPRVLDIGTGSGCLAVTLALELEGAEVHAVDLSEEALDYARRNAETLGASVTFHLGDGRDVARDLASGSGRFDLVVSNPPYVEPGEREALAPEVREHEPPLALYAPLDDPDHWLHSLVELSPEILVPGGSLLVELGHLQGARVLPWLEARARHAGASYTSHEDLAGTVRVVEWRSS